MATVNRKGNPIHTYGDLPAVGTVAPDFHLVDGDLKEVSLSDFEGKRKVISIVPSLDTSVCAESVRKFNARAAGLANTVVLVVSADLPYAQKRFCDTEGIQNVKPLSIMRGRGFAKEYGMLMTDGPMEGIMARAVVVLDERNKVIHSQLVPEIGQEPDYDAALAVLGG